MLYLSDRFHWYMSWEFEIFWHYLLGLLIYSVSLFLLDSFLVLSLSELGFESHQFV